MFLTLVFVTKKNKTRGVAIVGSICKILYNLKLIKDYESVFNKMADNLLICSNSFNYNKLLMSIEIVSNVLMLIVKFLIVHLSMATLVLADSSIVGEVIIKCFIIEAIFMAYPLPKGVLIYELLFVFLFSSLIPNGFLFYVMILYRVFDLFLGFINCLVVKLLDSVIYKSKKQPIKVENSTVE